MVHLKWLGKRPKTVELPIPFLSRSEKTGEVICDPIGEFSDEDAERLMQLSGKDGLWECVIEESVLVPVLDMQPVPVVAKKRTSAETYNFTRWHEAQRKKRAKERLEASQPSAEASQAPSP